MSGDREVRWLESRPRSRDPEYTVVRRPFPPRFGKNSQGLGFDEPARLLRFRGVCIVGSQVRQPSDACRCRRISLVDPHRHLPSTFRANGAGGGSKHSRWCQHSRHRSFLAGAERRSLQLERHRLLTDLHRRADPWTTFHHPCARTQCLDDDLRAARIGSRAHRLRRTSAKRSVARPDSSSPHAASAMAPAGRACRANHQT